MIIVMKSGATAEQVDAVLKQIESEGLKHNLSKGEETTVIGVIGDERKIQQAGFKALPGVDRVMPVMKPFKRASRDFQQQDTVVRVKDVQVGGGTFTIIAGPCAVESVEQTLECARAVRKGGAAILRGGAFKPRTSPYSFQGLGKQGLEILAKAREETGLPVVTEVMTPEDVPLVAEFADCLQIGARNVQNFSLLKACGDQPKPVLLKRGLSSTIEELLLSAEYILARGNKQVILCERGIRTFEKYTRNTLDIAAVPVIKKISHLPVILDPSHAIGIRDHVPSLARAAAAVGADGVILEVHPHPEKALCDGAQSLRPEMFEDLVRSVDPILAAVGLRRS